LRPALLPAEELVDGRAEARRQAVLLHRRRRHLLLEQLDERAREVDEDHDQPALRGLLHVRQQQAALLDRPRVAGGAAEGDRAVHPAEAAGGRDDVLVGVLVETEAWTTLAASTRSSTA